MSNIEWTDATWNPVTGCRHAGPGCLHCYAETMSKRLAAMGQAKYQGVIDEKGRFNGRALTWPDELAKPLRWKKPRMVFVNSMSDLFHDDVPFEFIAAVFGVMAGCPRHTFQVLTKRPARALEFFEWAATRESRALGTMYAPYVCESCALEHIQACHLNLAEDIEWPLKNVWLGVSVACQKDADALVPILLKCPAAVRFVSAEPLIGHVQLNDLHMERPDLASGFLNVDALNDCSGNGCNLDVGYGKLDWVIVGGESGHGARPFDIAWARSIVAQCDAAGVPVFVKQLGAVPLDSTGETRAPIYTIGGAQIGERVANAALLHLKDKKGGDPSEWPEDLRVREFPKQEPAHA